MFHLMLYKSEELVASVEGTITLKPDTSTDGAEIPFILTSERDLRVLGWGVKGKCPLSKNEKLVVRGEN